MYDGKDGGDEVRSTVVDRREAGEQQDGLWLKEVAPGVAGLS